MAQAASANRSTDLVGRIRQYAGRLPRCRRTHSGSCSEASAARSCFSASWIVSSSSWSARTPNRRRGMPEGAKAYVLPPHRSRPSGRHFVTSASSDDGRDAGCPERPKRGPGGPAHSWLSASCPKASVRVESRRGSGAALSTHRSALVCAGRSRSVIVSTRRPRRGVSSTLGASPRKCTTGTRIRHNIGAVPKHGNAPAPVVPTPLL